MKNLLALIILAALPYHSYASIQSSPSTVNMITVGDTYIRVKLASMTPAENCQAQHFYLLDISDGKNQAQYSAILTAKATQSEIFFLLSGCEQNYPKITHTYLP